MYVLVCRRKNVFYLFFLLCFVVFYKYSMSVLLLFLRAWCWAMQQKRRRWEHLWIIMIFFKWETGHRLRSKELYELLLFPLYPFSYVCIAQQTSFATLLFSSQFLTARLETTTFLFVSMMYVKVSCKKASKRMSFYDEYVFIKRSIHFLDEEESCCSRL